MTKETKGLFEFGVFRLDARERLLLRQGETIPLTPKAFDLLLALVERHGRLVEKEELFGAVWPDAIVEESNLSSNIALIRRAINDGENGQRFIETVPKRGYRFVGEVREIVTTVVSPAVTELHGDQIKAGSSIGGWLTTRSAGIVAGSLLMAGVVGWWWWYQRPPETPRLQIVPLTALPGIESQPSFSPDGNQIAFVWNGERGDNVDIYVKQIGNEALVRLTTDPASDGGPAWSPDGRYIAFTRRAEKEIGLFVVPSLGGAERKIASLSLTLLPEFGLRLSWTPDSDQLLVQDRESPKEPYGFYLVGRETGEKRRIAMPQSIEGLDSPVISPDGGTVAFMAGRPGMKELFLVPVSGGEPKKVALDRETNIGQPTWMPDGRSILFLSNRNSVPAVYLWKVAVTGGTPVRVDGAERNLSNFTVSAKGNRLAWTQTTNDTNIWRMDLDGAGRATLPSRQLVASSRLDMDPRISPDGRKIALTSDRSGSWQIWVCQSDGSRPIQLTNFSDGLTGSPRWSPDGSEIAFDHDSGPNADVYVIAADGGKPRQLTVETSKDVLPSWSRDGKWVYFCSNRSGSQEIWKMPALGGQATEVSRNGGFECLESFDGRFLYFTKGYQVTGIWRIPSGGGDDELVLNHNGIGQWRYWTLTADAIWFATAQALDQPLIERYDLGTGKIAAIASLERRIGYYGFAGLDVSPDSRWMIWSQMDQAGSDIMLTENFR